MTGSKSSGKRQAKRVAKALLPPVIPYALRRVLAGFAMGELAEWEYLPGGWAQASPSIRGWNAQSVVDIHLATWEDFRKTGQSTGPFGLSHASDEPSSGNYALHNTLMSYAYVPGPVRLRPSTILHA